MTYTHDEVTQLIDTLDKLVDDIESLSSQLREAEEKNRNLMAVHSRICSQMQQNRKTLH